MIIRIESVHIDCAAHFASTFAPSCKFYCIYILNATAVVQCTILLCIAFSSINQKLARIHNAGVHALGKVVHIFYVSPSSPRRSPIYVFAYVI